MDKNYVVDEYERNLSAKLLYTALLKSAYGPDAVVMVSHHITVMLPDSTVHEIPSADTILFDHDIMRKAFGTRSLAIIGELSRVPANMREDELRRVWTKAYS